MPLSERLKAVSQLITPGLTVADVGCDHGYLAIYLIRNGISPHAIAMDVGEGPLSRAKEHVRESGLTEDIELRLSDGLCELKPGEADCVVMAGMGGMLMTDIMKRGREVLDGVKEIILQPQSDIGYVRRFLEDNGYMIISEDIVHEDGKFYPVMKAVHGEMDLKSDAFYKFGSILLREQHPVLRMFLMQEMDRLNRVKVSLLSAPETDSVREGLKTVSNDLNDVMEALEYCEGNDPIAVRELYRR
ncbi:MAG: class I SAM-dependent methyltransferase [Lachnospiraceae bacterium]|nr:class I SAM-dependent methyltransferase [Lachnospiraceae bacterium]